ncbi:MAG: hypothetical protein ACPGJS_15660 [Flammeovirgaceae bacterium]
MRYLFLCVFIIGLSSCEKQENTDVVKSDVVEEEKDLKYEFDSLTLYYPADWALAESIDDAGSNLVTINPTDSLSSGRMSVAIFQAALPQLNTLLSIKGSVYLNLDVDPEAIQESEAGEITYQGVPALYQSYSARSETRTVDGQFIILNKSEHCYVIYFQTNQADSQINRKVFETFERNLLIR